MKTCSINSYLNEIAPWLDSDYILKAGVDGKGHFILHFVDGTRHSYVIDACSKKQLDTILRRLKWQGIEIDQ